MKFSSNHLLAIATTLAIGFTSCQPDDNTTYTVPETYNFENVSYTGQQDRLDMLGELTSYIKTAHTANAPALDAAKLKDMYGDNTGNHFSTTELNSSTKQLKSKTVATEQSKFEAYLDAAAVASQATNMTAASGQAGIGSNNAGTKHYLLNENGIELAQIIDKGLMGACFYYQGTAVYLGDGKMNVDNNLVNAGKGTNMEHHWDEAFGYFGVPKVFPATDANDPIRFWGKYCNKHEAVYPLNEKMMNAFLKGRAAISAKDLATRDEQITILQKNWELVVVATSIYYLNKSKGNLSTDPVAAYHGLSEAFAFIMSLKYGAGTDAITNAQVDTILSNLFGSADPLQANNYNITETKIEAAKNALVGYFSDLASVKDSL